MVKRDMGAPVEPDSVAGAFERDHVRDFVPTPWATDFTSTQQTKLCNPTRRDFIQEDSSPRAHRPPGYKSKRSIKQMAELYGSKVVAACKGVGDPITWRDESTSPIVRKMRTGPPPDVTQAHNTKTDIFGTSYLQSARDTTDHRAVANNQRVRGTKRFERLPGQAKNAHIAPFGTNDCCGKDQDFNETAEFRPATGIPSMTIKD